MKKKTILFKFVIKYCETIAQVNIFLHEEKSDN